MWEIRVSDQKCQSLWSSLWVSFWAHGVGLPFPVTDCSSVIFAAMTNIQWKAALVCSVHSPWYGLSLKGSRSELKPLVTSHPLSRAERGWMHSYRLCSDRSLHSSGIQAQPREGRHLCPEWVLTVETISHKHAYRPAWRRQPFHWEFLLWWFRLCQVGCWNRLMLKNRANPLALDPQHLVRWEKQVMVPCAGSVTSEASLALWYLFGFIYLFVLISKTCIVYNVYDFKYKYDFIYFMIMSDRCGAHLTASTDGYLSLRLDWSTNQIPGQLGLYRKTLSWKKNNFIQVYIALYYA